MTDKPIDYSAELSLAGVMFMDAEHYIDEISDALTESDFRTDIGKAVFKAACSLREAGEPLTMVSIGNKMTAAGRSLRPGEWEQLSSYIVSAVDVHGCIQVMKSISESLKLQNLFSSAIVDLMDRQDPDSVAAQVEDALQALRENRATSSIIEAEESVQELEEYRGRLEAGKADAFIPTGLPNLDVVFNGGLFLGGVYVAAARPGVGKTALALAIADQVAVMGGIRTLYVSLEMRPVELLARCVAMRSGIPSTAILRKARLTPDEQAHFEDAKTIIRQSGLVFNRVKRIDVQEIAHMCRRSQCKLLIVDYLGLVREKEGKDRYEKVTKVSNDLKELALDLDIPVLALAQLNRQASASEAPKLADLRDSGAIEQDADGVLLMYREMMDPKGNAILAAKVGKNRHGQPGGVVRFAYQPSTNIIIEAGKGANEPEYGYEDEF